MTLALGLCGCGVMGRRHVLGLGRLREVGRLPFELAGVCDVVAESAEQAADLAADLLGSRPTVFQTFAQMQAALSLDAVDVATSPDRHTDVGVEALRAGVHVIVEKPIALTVRQGATLVRVAAETGRKLAVAENYRRDPINRLAKALLEAGAIGRPFLIIQSSSGSGERVMITPWRHLKRSGGIIVDMGVHYADLFEYYLGPVASLIGMNDVVDEQRRDTDGVWHAVDAEDLTVGVARFESGALANLVLNLAGRGEAQFTRVLYGTGGSLSIPNDRSGQPVKLVVRQGDTDVAVAETDLLTMAPAFALDETTAALFGGDRLTSYAMEWADIDAALLGIELADFGEAIMHDRKPEVSGDDGLRSLAVIYGFLESDRLGRVVTVEELLRDDHAPYQRELDAVAGKTPP